ncbi:MAG: hypothetical protein QME58_11115 [Bacteroidota bacterium]|nr:hypothetical protein [Bacteroidota bacterium]
MPDNIISDTSCFTVLTNIGELDLLQKTYGQVITTNEVATEFGQQLPDRVKIKSTTDKYKQQILELQVDNKIRKSDFRLTKEIELQALNEAGE